MKNIASAELVAELDECVHLDHPPEVLVDNTDESMWTKRTEKQEEKWLLLRHKLFEETLAYSGFLDPNVSYVCLTVICMYS